MQAMNGTRSAELSASELLLESGGSDPVNEQQPSTGGDNPIIDASEHAGASSTALAQPALQQAEQAAEQQAGVPAHEGSPGMQPQSDPSWQQSEGSMQEVASTSASSESGIMHAHLLLNHGHTAV